MASSTTKPVAIVSDISEKLFQAEAQQYTRPERPDQRDRDGDGGNERGADIPEEDRRPPMMTRMTRHQRALRPAFNEAADGDRPVVGDFEVDIAGIDASVPASSAFTGRRFR